MPLNSHHPYLVCLCLWRGEGGGGREGGGDVYAIRAKLHHLEMSTTEHIFPP